MVHKNELKNSVKSETSSSVATSDSLKLLSSMVGTSSCQENASNIEQHSDASPTSHLQRTTLAFAQNWATLSYFTD